MEKEHTSHLYPVLLSLSSVVEGNVSKSFTFYGLPGIYKKFIQLKFSSVKSRKMSTPTLSKCFICTKESEDGRVLFLQESYFVLHQLLGVPPENQTNFDQWTKFKNVCYCCDCLEKILNVRVMVGEFEKLEENILTERETILKQLVESSNFCKESPNPKGMLQMLREEIIQEIDMTGSGEILRLRSDSSNYDDNSPESDMKTLKLTPRNNSLSKSVDSHEETSERYQLRPRKTRKGQPELIVDNPSNSSKCVAVAATAKLDNAIDNDELKSMTVSIDKNSDDFDDFVKTITSEVHYMNSSDDGEMEILSSNDTRNDLKNEKQVCVEVPQPCQRESISYMCATCDEMFDDYDSFEAHESSHKNPVRANRRSTLNLPVEHNSHPHKADCLVLTDDETISKNMVKQTPNILQNGAKKVPKRTRKILKQTPNIPKQGAVKVLERNTKIKKQTPNIPQKGAMKGPKCNKKILSQRAAVLTREGERVSKLGRRILKQDTKVSRLDIFDKGQDSEVSEQDIYDKRRDKNVLKQDPKLFTPCTVNLKQDLIILKQDGDGESETQQGINMEPELVQRKRKYRQPLASANLKLKKRKTTPYFQPKTCEECGKVLSDKGKLKNHILVVHCHEGSHKCKLCDYTCQYPSKLRVHMITRHSNIRPFVCDLCKQSFKRIDTLRKHKKSHEGLTPYKCKLCLGRFKNLNSLGKHRSHVHCLKT